MATSTQMGRDLLLSSSNKSLRAATIRIRFADIIVKAKCRKLIEESDGGNNNKADAMMTIKREKHLLVKKQREEKARALRLKLREEARLAVEKTEEEARNNAAFGDRFSPVKDLMSICGGSRVARSRCWFKKFGLVLRPVVDYDDDESLEARDDIEEGEIV